MINIFRNGPDTSQDHLVGLTYLRESRRPVVVYKRRTPLRHKVFGVLLVVAALGLWVVSKLDASTVMGVL